MKLVIKNRKVEQLKTNLFFIGLLTLTAIIIWVSVSVYSSFNKTTVDDSIQTIIQPINPTLDSEALSTFASTRVAAPEQFQVIGTFSSKEDVNSKTTKLIDPFAQ